MDLIADGYLRKVDHQRATQEAAFGALIGLARDVADAEEPAAVARLLANAAATHLGAHAIAVFATDDAGDISAVELRGCTAAQVPRPQLLEPESWSQALRGVPEVAAVEAHPLASGGGLFGVMLLGWAAPESADGRSDLASGLADTAAIALDRAYRTRELERTILELEARRGELARTEALRQLGQMSAVVAHEVKNPLASMSGVLQVLRNRFPAEGEEHRMVGKVLDRLTDLNRMLEELLQFARPAAPVRAEVALSALLGEVAAAVSQDAANRALEIAIDAEPITAAVDRARLQRALLNLAINGAQAMGGAGRLTLRCAAADRAVELTVSDTGPGVPQEVLDRMFEPFVTTKVRGTGLGLAIARQAAEAHGGTLGYRAAECGGACFVLRLPR